LYNIEDLNEGFEDTPFSFYQCEELEFIDNDDYETFYLLGDDQEDSYTFYDSDKAIDIYMPKLYICHQCVSLGYFTLVREP